MKKNYLAVWLNTGMENIYKIVKANSKRCLCLVLFFLFFFGLKAQINISAGNTVSENFNAFTNPATLPTGWKWSKDAGTHRQINTAWTAASTLAADNTMPTASCASTNGSYYAFNTVSGVGGTDRCMAFLSSGSATLNGNLYVALNNNGAGSITSFTISYAAKKFRNGSNANGFRIAMFYSTNGTSWTAMPSNFNTSFAADANNNCPTTTSAGTLPSITNNIVTQTFTPSSAVAASSVVYFAWNYSVSATSTTSNAQLIGVDDISIAANGNTNYYWNGPTTSSTSVAATGGTGTWNTTTTNWKSPTNDNLGPATAWSNGASNIANFSAGFGTVTLATDITASDINAASGVSYIISAPAAQTITSKINMVGDLSFTATGVGSITLPGVIDGTGSMAFNSTGPAYVTVNGNNTHTGPKNIMGGLVNLGHANALGASGTLTLTGGSIDNISAADITTPNYPQTWPSGTFTYVGSIAGRNLNLGTGAVSLTGSKIFTVTANTLTVGGNISGANAITKLGAGTLSLTGNNSLIASIANNGTGIFNLTGTNTLDASAVVSNNAAGTLNFSGTKSMGQLSVSDGTINLSGTSTYASGTSISGGTLALGSINTLPSGGSVSMSGGALNTGGFSQAGLGTLAVTGATIINLTNSDHSINFAASNLVSWTGGALTINGWQGTGGSSGTAGKIFFGSSFSTLTPAQRAQITFTGYPGTPMILATGELVPFGPSTFTSVMSGDWNDLNTWDQGAVPGSSDLVIIRAVDVVHTGAVLTRDASTTVNGGFELRNGGYAGGTTNFTYAATGSSLIFNNGSLYGIGAGQRFWPATNSPFNVTVNGGGSGADLQAVVGARTVAGTLSLAGQFNVGAAGGITVTGTLLMNGGGYVSSNTPIYGGSSTLVYNTTYGVGTEWTGNATTAGAGVPQNVTIQNTSAVTMPGANRGMAGNLNVNSGSLVLNAAGDFYIAGNWNRAAATGFTPAGKAVFFNGNTLQTISTAGGETFNYLILNNSNVSGVRLLSNVTVNATAGSGLQLINSGPFDLNGFALNLPSNGGGIYVNGASRTITSATAATVNVTGSKTVSNNAGTGTLVFGANVTIILTNNFDFGFSGAPISTVQGTLQINPFGAVNTNPPVYTAASTLIYNTGGSYSNVAEWTAGAVNTVTAGYGIPGNVIIQATGTNVGLAGARGLQGNLTVSDGATLTLNGAANQDLYTKGNLVFTGSGALAGNNKAIFFVNNAATQTISSAAPLTIPYVVLAPATGNTTVQLLSNLTVSAPLTGNVVSFNSAGDILDINGQTLTLGAPGFANVINGLGTFKGSGTSNLTLRGTGSIGTLRFTSGSQLLGNLVIDRSAAQLAATLGTGLAINGTGTQFTNGLLNIAGFNLVFALTATHSGAGSNSFVQADGTGYVYKVFNASNLAFTYPVGDNAAPDGAQYTPAAIDFTGSSSFSGFSAGIRIADVVHPNMGASVDYISRYWSLNTIGSLTNPVYSFTGTYTAADIVGTEANALAARWDGSGWTYGSAIGANTLSLTGLTDLTSTNDFSARAVIPCADLFFSEYLEGSSNNKYLEIYNPTSSSINLSNYRIALYANGVSSPTNTLALTGTIAAYSTYVIGHQSATLYTPNLSNNTIMNYNGDDAIALQTSAGVNVDIIGRIGEDPGTAWTAAGGYSTLDKTLVRKITVNRGVTANPGSGFPTLATEWDLYDADVVSNLGWHNSLCNPQVAGYFQSNGTGGGNWGTVSTWLAGPTSTGPWVAANTIPTSYASGIFIQAADIVSITNTVTVNKTTVSGILQLLNGGSNNGILNLFDGGAADELTILNGGRLRVVSSAADYNAAVLYNTSGNINVNTGGVITIGNGTATHTAGGFYVFGIETSSKVTWNNQAIFDWNTTGVVLSIGNTGGTTYFPSVNAATVPILRVSQTVGPGAWGTGFNTFINGILKIDAPNTFQGSGNKTIRDGITGTSTLTIPSSVGTITINGAAPILGGAALTINSDKNINIGDNISLTVPVDSVVTMVTTASGFAKGVNSNFVVNGTANMGIFTISNTTGAVTINGTLRTAHPGGLENTGSGGTVSTTGSVTNVNNGSTIEYNAAGNQAVTGSAVLEPNGAGGDTYRHIKFSGSGTKTLSNATAVQDSVSITGTAIVDAMTNNLGSTVGEKFIMDGGRLRLGTGGTQPNMNGTYNLTGGVVEFGATSGGQTIRGTANNAYQNIEVTGTDVSNSSGNVNLNGNGTFTIKPTGNLRFTSAAIVGPAAGNQTFTMETGSVFRVANEYGFNGTDNAPTIPYLTAAVQLNVENIVLQTGSTIDYNRAAPLVAATQTITTTVPYQHLILSGENAKNPAVGVTLEIKGNLTKSGTSTSFAHNEGTVLFSGTAAQNYTVNAGSSIMDFNNFTNNNAGGLNINSDAGVNQKLTMGASAALNLVDTADMILRSKPDTTAWVGNIPSSALISYPGTGRFVVERYIGRVGNWNLAASPTAEAQSVAQSWQEGTPGTFVANGYGTRITGPGAVPTGMGANGLDQASVGYSLKSWDAITNQWRMVQNTLQTVTDSLVNRHTGYFIFVRGDRGTAPGATGSATTLRSRGKLYIGNAIEPLSTRGPVITYPGALSLPSGRFISVANPFASPIDFTLINKSNLKNQFSVWDPEPSGNYGVGRYITFSSASGIPWEPTPTPVPTSPYSGVASNTTIQSGQAFMVETNVAATNTIINFSTGEAAKVNGSRTVMRDPQMPGVVAGMSTMLHKASNGLVADGNRVAFDDAYEDAIGSEDAHKIANSGENFGVAVQGKTLIVEGRKRVTDADTIFYQMNNLLTQNYRLSFEPRNMNNTGLTAELIDKYLNSRTPVSLSDSTWYNFAATTDAASKAADRFMLVFRAVGGPLPVTFVSIAAQRQQDRSIKVNWEVANEVNIEKYEVQRSADGTNFTGILTSDATNSRLYTKNDLSPLSADNFYRIKAIGVAGDITYSGIVKVAPDKQPGLIVVQPNPVKDKQLNIRFSNQPAGDYALQLTNTLGQLIYNGTVTVTNNAQVRMIALPSTVAGGNYQLVVRNKAGEAVYSETIIIE